ncbi:hypothetical protein DWF00_06570 [Bosea caraganae]|uniref:Type II toxin-antitoxin system PemK/MazF family toxin n=1 Tax=Bosea caraganae TaxID=2763117 RepID=A0A370L407_9HYPH|nr:hypothetical protein [Bosea caraganae]RDJ23019.1 hypothetical protein DWE98_17815 [Bosea caraganae]RDJ28799.1 hypothetical protein DWF00_06570 [Bosea caraganae]
MFEQGDILRFYYLWSHQVEDGEESGRKDRPVCLVVRTPSNPALLYLFPLTSKQPGSDRLSLPIGQFECRRTGLDFPTWLIVDEYNVAASDELFDLASPTAIGSLSRATMTKVATLVKLASAERRLKGVRRGP